MKRLMLVFAVLILTAGCVTEEFEADQRDIDSVSQEGLNTDGFQYNALRSSNGLPFFNGLGVAAPLAGNGFQVRFDELRNPSNILACRCDLTCPDGSLVFHPICCSDPSFEPQDACE